MNDREDLGLSCVGRGHRRYKGESASPPVARLGYKTSDFKIASPRSTSIATMECMLSLGSKVDT